MPRFKLFLPKFIYHYNSFNKCPQISNSPPSGSGAFECGLSNSLLPSRRLKGKKSWLFSGGTWHTLLTQMTKLNITSDKSCWYYVITDGSKRASNLSVFFLKIHKPSIIMRKHLTNPNSKMFYRIFDRYSSKISRTLEARKEWQIRREFFFWIKG